MDRQRRRTSPADYQPDLFQRTASRPDLSLPEWTSLPPASRSAATSLLARILIAHALADNADGVATSRSAGDEL